LGGDLRAVVAGPLARVAPAADLTSVGAYILASSCTYFLTVGHLCVHAGTAGHLCVHAGTGTHRMLAALEEIGKEAGACGTDVRRVPILPWAD
jgi:hypothetical protein